MSDTESNNSSFHEEEGPSIEVVYPLNEETEVPSTKGQLFKKVLIEGSIPDSKPPRGAKVTVHYVGTLNSNGDKFDSSRDRNDPFIFTIGQGQVIKGWDQGVATMNKGEKCILKCLPNYAYGAAGSPPKIPANSTLDFEVELLDWTCCEDVSEAKDGSMIKDTVVAGNGHDSADYESTATVDVIATEFIADGAKEVGLAGAELFRKEGWNIVCGVDDIPVGLPEALRKMKRGEKAVVLVKAHAVDAYKKAVALEEKSADKEVWASEFDAVIPAGKSIRYEITLKEFSTLQTYNYKGMDKVNEGKKRKDEGNVYFAQGKWFKAVNKYSRGLEFISNDYDLKDDAKEEAKKLKVIILGNLAQVYLNTNRNKEALDQVNLALLEDGSSLKNLFRRAKALGALDEWDDAEKDLVRILDNDAANEPAKLELAAVKARRAAYEKKMKSRYANMFAKIAEE